MTEEMMQAIAEAEAKAADMKNAALEKAAAIVKEAEETAAKMKKSSAEVCKAYRETQLKEAEREAQKNYEASLEKTRTAARANGDRILANAEVPASVIVGRILNGNR